MRCTDQKKTVGVGGYAFGRAGVLSPPNIGIYVRKRRAPSLRRYFRSTGTPASADHLQVCTKDKYKSVSYYRVSLVIKSVCLTPLDSICLFLGIQKDDFLGRLQDLCSMQRRKLKILKQPFESKQL